MKKQYILPAIIIFFFVTFLFSMLVQKPNKTKEEKWMREGWGMAVEPRLQPSINKSNYIKALEAGKKTHKPILLYFKADWCGWCKKMEVDALAKPSVRNVLSKYVYCVIDSDKEKEIAQKYKVTTIPAYVVINSNEEVLKSGKGYKTESAFLLWINSKSGDSKFWSNVVWH